MHCVAGTKEVAERLYAQPGSKAFGRCRVQYLAQCELICPVPAEDFSSTAKGRFSCGAATSPQIIAPLPDPHRFETLVKLGFAAKRKMLRNNLKGIDRDHLTQLLEQ